MSLTPNNDIFQTVFDSAQNGIAVLEPVFNDKGKVADFSILLFNKYTLNWITDIDYKGRRYSEIFPMATTNGILEKFIAVAETGTAANFEAWYDGEGMKYWFRFNAVKQDELLVVTTIDITEERRTELALSDALYAADRQRRLYDSITSNTPDLVYVFTLDYKFAYANQALLTMWGKPAGAAIGLGLRENGYEEWHAQMHEREIDEIVTTKKNVRGTVSFPHAELGSRVYDYILVPVLNEKGEVEAVAGTTRDITEIRQAGEKLKHSEARFRNMIEQAPVAMLLSTGEDVIIENVNIPMLEIMNKASEAEVLGKKMLEVLPEFEGQPVYTTVMAVQKTGMPFRGNDIPVNLMVNGKLQRRYFNFSYNRFTDNEGKSAVLHMASDVTEQVLSRKKIEESESRYKVLSETLEHQVNERTKELLRSNGDLQQFAHVASHDLKEPVRKVKTFVSRLEDHLGYGLDDVSRRYIERIHVATDRMFTMIDGVLGYSKINAGLQTPEPVDLNEIIDDIENDLEVALHKRGGKITYHNLPTIEGAEVLIYQLFYNLINNSVKFARAGIPPEISITSETVEDKGGNLARITLQDNGIGFNPDYASRIFETFTRLNSKDEYEGTGLGLSLCKKIVERHGGTIAAIGDPNKGATFIMTLPFHQTQTDI